MQLVTAGQISLQAAKRAKADITVSNISVSGKLKDLGALVFEARNTPMDGPNQQPQLDHGEVVHVTLADADGNVFASVTGTVEIGFKDTNFEGTDVTVREQRVKL